MRLRPKRPPRNADLRQCRRPELGAARKLRRAKPSSAKMGRKFLQTMIKLSDYIAKRLSQRYGVEHVFMVSGGGAMHLNDSFGRYIPYTANHHEQACAIAGEGYGRAGGKLAVVNVTTGPGGLNCLNGVFGQWTDSIGVLYISGQVKFRTTLAYCPELPLRQLGDQEVDIVSSVRHLTKYAAMVADPREIKYHLDRAVYEAMSGRRGPVWLDIPMDVQSAMIDEDNLREFVPPAERAPDAEEMRVAEIADRLKAAKRPLIVAGHGIRLAGMRRQFMELLDKTNIPVATTFNGFDVIATDHKNYAGRIGSMGQRAGNFNLQNADCILFLGTRNNIRQVSYNWENFARRAFKIAVDIDAAELEKPLVRPDLAVCADLRYFLPAFAEAFGAFDTDAKWARFCRDLVEKYSFKNTPEYAQKPGGKINIYNFIHRLTELASADDVFVCANGSACVASFGVFEVKDGSRMFWNSGDASMGYDLPAAIGAQRALPSSRIVCLTGDGSIMMNIQELQTIAHNRLPIKIFVMNNGGYSSIKQTQNNFFDGRMTACGATSGVTTPDFCDVARAFKIKSVRLENPEELDAKIRETLSCAGPVLCQVECDPDYIFVPKLSARRLPDGSMQSPPLEDMYPFLDRAEFEKNIVK